jgi:hypothetical protein
LRPIRAFSCAIAAGVAALTLGGCSTIRQTFHSQDHATKRSEQLQILQLRSMRFADEYVGSIVQPIRSFQASTEDAADRLSAQNWLLSQATAAYTIASGPSPPVNAIDMVVLATLSRMVIDDAWSSEHFGERAASLRDTYHRLEPLALELAQGALASDQIAELRQAILKWRAQNPHVTAISFVHFRDVAASMGQAAASGGDSLGGLFSLLGLDPFSSLDPAVREIARTRELAERTIYYAQRVPSLLDMQVERVTYEFATMPEMKRLFANADSVTNAANTTGRVVGELPALLSREREAAIRQFMEAVTAETSHTRQLAAELRGTLEAGTEASNSLVISIRAFDQLMTRFDKPPPPAGTTQTPGRPFNITEYTDAAGAIAQTAKELEGLIASVNRDNTPLMLAADRATAALQGVIERAYWLLVRLIVILLLGGLAATLAYRAIVGHWRA